MHVARGPSVLCALPRFQLAVGEPDSEVVLWVRAAVQLAPLRPRTVGVGVPSWRQLRRRPSLRRQGCGPLPRWRARSLEARPGPRGPSAPRFPALSHTQAGSRSRGCLGAQRGRRPRHPPPPLWSASLQADGRTGAFFRKLGTEGSPPSARHACGHLERARGAGAFQLPMVAGPRRGRARPGGDRAWCVPRAARLAAGEGIREVSLSSLVPPAACPGAGSHFRLGQDLTGAKLWTEEVPGFLEVAGPQAVMPRGADRWMGQGEASKDFSRPGDQKRGVGWGGGAALR